MNKKTIYFIVGILAAIIAFAAYFIFFTYSDHYTITCYGPGSKNKEIKNIPCNSDNDCSVKSMALYCSPDYPDLLKCANAKYYCDNGYCTGCDCISPNYIIDKRPDGIYEDRKEKNSLKTKCCDECKTAFSKSPAGFGPEMAMCGNFSSRQPVSASCKLFFENNPMSVSACESYLKTKSQNNFDNDYIEKSITDYLLTQKYFSWSTTADSHNHCVIENLNPTEKNLFPLYVWVRCGEFVMQDEKLKELSGKSAPAKINYPNHLSFYDISKMSHETPRSGSLYSEDIKTIFPLNVQKIILDFDIANLANISKKIKSAALNDLKQ